MAACWKMVENVDGVGEFLEDLKKNTFQKYDAFTVGEVFNMKADELGQFIGDNGHFSTIFDFCAHSLSDGAHGWYDAPHVDFKTWRDTILSSQINVQKYGLEANIIENHDEPRGVSRFLPEYAQTPVGAKMLGTVNILLRGIPFIYQGQEIGMKNAKWNSIDEFDDISTKDQYQIAREAGLSDREAMEVCNRMSRDNARTPMQWSSEDNAGFSKGKPWMPVNENYKVVNVAEEEKEYGSILNFYKRLIAFYKSEEYNEILTYGDFRPIYEKEDHIFAYSRSYGCQKLVLICNFSSKEKDIELSEDYENVVFVNYEQTTVIGNTLKMKPYECVIYEM